MNEYYMDKNCTNNLKKTTLEKDVGVTFSSNLKFDEHINNVIGKANKITGFIKSSFSHLDIDFFQSYTNVLYDPILSMQT